MLKTFEKKLTLIKEELEEVFTRLIKANTISLTGITDKDPERFKEAKNALKNLDETCDSIDQNVVTTLALFSPEAKDLRRLVSYLKITSALHKTAQNIRSYNKVLEKNFEDYEQYFNDNSSLIELQNASIKALEVTFEIAMQSDETVLKVLYEKITQAVEDNDKAFEVVEERLMTSLTPDSLKAHLAQLKTFRKLDKITNRAFDISNTLICAKLDHIPLVD